MALCLTIAYGMAWPVPFIAPIFALMIAAPPTPPMPLKSLVSLIMVLLVTLGIGLLLIPMLINYPLSAVLIVGVGLYYSNYLSINLGKGLVGTFLTIGFTMIPLAGMIDFAVAVTVIQALVLSIMAAVIIHRLVYPLFPEDPTKGPPATPAPVSEGQSNWAAMRATLIVLPSFLLALTNPSFFLPIIMKSVMLGQQGSMVDARHAGRELLGSTFLGGVFAGLFWFLLKIYPDLWMFTLWMLLFGIYFSAKLYGLIASRYPGSFWVNVAVTMLILLGPAVQDSADGTDPYKAFAVRMALFVGVTFYAWTAIVVLERIRARRLQRISCYADR